MLTKRQLVKVLDFGLAKFLRPLASDSAATIDVTLPGMVLGTLNYMAPEQLRGGEVDHRVDLFAAGAVLYEMLAGRPPFQAETMADSADRILNHEPEALARFNYAVPADVDALVRKALAKDPGVPLPVGPRALRRPAPRARPDEPRQHRRAHEPAARA